MNIWHMNLIRVFWNEAEKWLTFFAVLTFFMSMACMFNWWHDRNRIFWTIFWSKTKYLITKFDFCLLFITARDVLKSENNGFWFYDSNSKVSMEWTLRVKGTHPFPLLDSPFQFCNDYCVCMASVICSTFIVDYFWDEKNAEFIRFHSMHWVWRLPLEQE